MSALLLALLFAAPARAQNPPYTITETKTGRDAAALNQDLRALSDAIRKTDATARLLTSSVAATVADFVRTGGTHTLSGALTFDGGNSFRGTTTIGYQTGKTGALQGGWYAVAYSSGLAVSVEFVLTSSQSYRLEYSASVTSGTTSLDEWIYCRVNNDTTAANYRSIAISYPSPYNTNNQGGTASFGISQCGSGAVDTGGDLRGWMAIGSIQKESSTLFGIGQFGGFCPAIGLQYASMSFRYSGAGPWTLRCGPAGIGVGWDHEFILMQYGK